MPITDYKAFAASLDATTFRYLYAVSVRENAASPAAATVLIRNGGATGDVVVPIELAGNESKHLVWDQPVYFPAGIYIDVAAGTVQGSISAK